LHYYRRRAWRMWRPAIGVSQEMPRMKKRTNVRHLQATGNGIVKSWLLETRFQEEKFLTIPCLRKRIGCQITFESITKRQPRNGKPLSWDVNDLW
jgi:hypothetical protein